MSEPINPDPNLDLDLWFLDYGAGNVCSARNLLDSLGLSYRLITSASEIVSAQRIFFPGVGAFQSAIQSLTERGWLEPLRAHLLAGKPFFGICIGMQLLFESSSEVSDPLLPLCPGLAIIPGHVQRFNQNLVPTIPHIGWAHVNLFSLDSSSSSLSSSVPFYFVHSYRAKRTAENAKWVLTESQYGEESFISSVRSPCGSLFACQFHPEKSAQQGRQLVLEWAQNTQKRGEKFQIPNTIKPNREENSGSASDAGLTSPRILACLDVRDDESGNLIVTKGDAYNVTDQSQRIRNLGDPVAMAQQYYEEGADEIVFLNIASSLSRAPLRDSPLISLLKVTAQRVFIPLTIGGGIRDYTDSNGLFTTAEEIADEYFRAGADKISIGSDAVEAAIEYWANGKRKLGKSSIERISNRYGAQAVVVSVDPRRVYVSDPQQTNHRTLKTVCSINNPHGHQYVWFQCTVKGGREGRDIDVFELLEAVQDFGAGELLLNCVDFDGQKSGFDLELLAAVAETAKIPVIASSGAGKPEHFVDCLKKTKVSAALAAGIFHRKEVTIEQVKQACEQGGIKVRKQ